MNTNINIPQLSLDTYIALGLVIATPWLYYLFSPYNSPSKFTTRDQVLSFLLLIHTLYSLHPLLVSQPPNIFKSLNLPPNVQPDYLRQTLLEKLGGNVQNVTVIPPYLDTLLKRLGSMDTRSLYFRFGHEVLTACSYCQSFNDYALYALPSSLLEYIREIGFIGALTLPTSPKAHLRPLGLGTLIALLMVEAYNTLTTQFVIPPIGDNSKMQMLHDSFVQTRHLVFLLLPLLLTIFPYLHLHQIPILNTIIPTPPPSTTNVPSAPSHNQPQGMSGIQQAPFDQLTSMTMQTLNHLVPTLHLIKYSHASIMRSQNTDTISTTITPSLHSLATKWWAEEAHEGSVIRNDENIQRIMRAAGWGFDEAVVDAEGKVIQKEGTLLTNAKKAVEMLKQGGSKSDHWVSS